MPDPLSNDDMAHGVAETIATMREVFAPMDDAALGYRAQLVAAGWSSSVAEQMAAQFFNLLIAMFTQGLKA
jgi:hypothetical protein